VRGATAQDAEVAQAARAAAEAIIVAVDDDSANEVVGELMRGLEDEVAGCRAAAAALSGFYFKSSQADLEEHTHVIIGVHTACLRSADCRCAAPPLCCVLLRRVPWCTLTAIGLCACAFTGALISQLADADASVVQAAWTALGEVTSVLPKDNLHLYVRTVRDAVASARDKVRETAPSRSTCRVIANAEHRTRGVAQERRRSRKDVDVLVAGFCLPKGLAPVLPIYLHAILTGAREMNCMLSTPCACGLTRFVAQCSPRRRQCGNPRGVC
jgi:hypothetical protein